MHPIHDVDALLLLATALSSKRRPAELVEIMAAADLIQGTIPTESKLVEAFARLSAHGLIDAQEGSFTLTAEAQKIITDLPKKAETAERLFGIKENLASYFSRGDQAPIELTEEQISVAIRAHRAAGKAAVKNLLMPKPKAAEGANKRPGQRQRKPLPARRRKD